MPKKSLYHVKDPDLFCSLVEHEDTFCLLPFALGNKHNVAVLEESGQVTKYIKDPFYVQLMQGIDWLVGVQHVDVLNLSLGLKHGVLDEDEPVHVATKLAFDNGAIVVAAAGNRGPRNDTLQAIARADWVISVGATNEQKVLLNRSSRGVPSTIGPTLVTNGRSDYVEKDPNRPQFLPSTSFACAKVSRIAAFVKLMVRHLASYFEAAINNTLNDMSPPIYFLRIGYADTGAPRNIDEYLHPTIRSFYEQGERKCCVEHGPDTIRCVYDVMDFLFKQSQLIRLIVEPSTVKDFLVVMCERMEGYDKHEVGAGYVDEEIAIRFWAEFSPQKLLRMQFPNLAREIDACFGEERFFFASELVRLLFDFAARGPSSHAKVY